MLFDVRVLSFDRSKKDPVEALMRVFKIEQDSAAQIVSSAPRIVKSGVPLETARRLSHILGALGASTEVVASGGRVRAAVGHDHAGHTPAEGLDRASQFALPKPNPEALGTALSKTPANGNAGPAEAKKTVANPVAAVKLHRVRAQRKVTEVPAREGVRQRDASLYMGRARVDSAPDPSILDLPDTLEADLSTTGVRTPRTSVPSGRPSGRPSAAPGKPARTGGGLVGLEPFTALTAPVGPRKAQLGSLDGVVVTTSLITVAMIVSLSFITLGALPVILAGCLVWDACKRWALRRSIESSALAIGPNQLPELHALMLKLATRLELGKAPRLFVTSGIARGLTSVTFMGESTLLVSADTLGEYAEGGQAPVLAFMVAHELSAVSLGQRGPLRGFLAWLWPAVRKLDVLAADALTAELLGQRSTVQDALVALLIGPRGHALFDRADLERQASAHESESRFYAPALEGQSEFLLARMHRMRRVS